jgi:hypothetical protein
MTTRIKLRRDTAANWTTENPILAEGEPGLETDTGRIKYGDGTTAWVSLDYAAGGNSLTDDQAVTVTVGNTDYFAIVNRANNDDDGVESSAVAYDSEGNLITLHISEVYDGTDNWDRLIISKFDSSANLLWQKQIQEEMDFDQAHDVVIDADDNIIVVCSRDANESTIQVIKYTSAGSELWKKDYHPVVAVPIYNSVTLLNTTITSGTFQGSTVDVVTLDYNESNLGAFNGWSLQESSDTGTTWTTIAAVLGFGAYDANADTTPLYLTANSGVTLSQEAGYEYRVTRQGSNSDLELGGAVTDGTHTFISASYQEDVTSELGPLSCLMKIANSNGELVWAKTVALDDTGGPIFPNQPYGMEIDSSGNLVIVGVQYTPGPTLTYVSKYSGINGTEIWTKILVLSDGWDSVGGDVTADSQGNVFVSINCSVEIVAEEDDTLTRTAVVITKLNSSGVVQWTRRVGPGPCASVGTGIDCDSLGNVYLSALTTAQKNPTRDDENFHPFDTRVARDVLAIAKYSTSGVVLWQRYIEADGYEFYQSRSVDNFTGNFDYDVNSGRNLSVSATGKLAVQVTVRKRDLDDYVYDSRYWESITFQIDQDGREMTIGSGDEKFTVKESRIPGKLVTLLDLVEELGETITVVVTDLTSDIEVTVPTITYADAELAQQVIKSAPYEYVFGNDGTLSIPNDGDVKLTQTQIGWFSIFGPVTGNPYNVWNRANCVDTATGDVYVAGQENDGQRGYVARYNRAGELLWSIRLYDNDDEDSTRCNAIKINPITGNVTVLVEYYGGPDAALIVEIDPDTAQIVNSLGFRDLGEDAGVNAYDFDFQSDGSVVVVGRKYDERRTYAVAPLAGSTTDVLVFNRNELDNDDSSRRDEYNSDWRISGTGFGFTSMLFNYYSGLTGTVRQGSGTVTFDIDGAGGGAYTLVAFNAAGSTNYLVGHKLKVLGSLLGGVNGVNDAILTVDAVGAGGVIEGFSGSVEGLAVIEEGNGFTEVLGTNYQTGSGLEFNFWGPWQGTNYGDYDDYGVVTAGTNYVTGDVVVIPGTQLGGTTPANDLTAVVNTSAGEVSAFANFTGTSQDSTYRIVVSESGVDFSGEGAWTLSYPLGAEAFVWTNAGAGWNKVVGSLNSDAPERYFSVATGSDGSIYAAGEIYTDDSTSRYQAVISKFNSTGTHQWSRALNPGIYGSEAKCVAVRGTTVAVSSYYDDNNETIITKLDTTGNIKWQRRTDSSDDSSVAIDTNGDIYAVAESNFENRFEDIIKVIRFASNGEPIWRKFFGTSGVNYSDTNEYFKNGRNITLDAEHFYVSGYTTAFDSDAERGFLVKLPKSGDCDGYYGGWTVQTEPYDVFKVNVTEANTFAPNIQTGNFEDWTPDILSNWWDPSDGADYYQQLDPVVDRDGGAIEFADGTRQTTSAQQIPQIKISTGADHRLSIDDMGKHIYVTNSDTRIIVPYDYDNPLPVGFTVVIVNNSGGTIDIDGDSTDFGGSISITVPGVDEVQYWLLDTPGMATLLKVDADNNTWFMTGNVTVTGP